jgi:hypothetical protein
MKKFMVTYMAPVTAIEQMGKASPEQMKAGMDEWTRWAKTHQKSIVDLGTPLGKTKRVTATGVADARNEMTGYSIVQADSLDAAAKAFTDHPHFKMVKGATIDVVECIPMPGQAMDEAPAARPGKRAM